MESKIICEMEMGDDECNDGGGGSGGDTASKIGNTVYARFSLFSHLILVHVSN